MTEVEERRRREQEQKMGNGKWESWIMRRPVQPESAMRGAGGIWADIAPEKNTDERDGRGFLGWVLQAARKAGEQSRAGQRDHTRHETQD
jgi:hypothetical protein